MYTWSIYRGSYCLEKDSKALKVCMNSSCFATLEYAPRLKVSNLNKSQRWLLEKIQHLVILSLQSESTYWNFNIKKFFTKLFYFHLCVSFFVLFIDRNKTDWTQLKIWYSFFTSTTTL